MKSIVNENISDSEFQDSKSTFPLNTPMNKEEYFYRTLFSKYLAKLMSKFDKTFDIPDHGLTIIFFE